MWDGGTECQSAVSETKLSVENRSEEVRDMGTSKGGLSWSRAKLDETDEWWEKRGVIAGRGGRYILICCVGGRDMSSRQATTTDGGQAR